MTSKSKFSRLQCKDKNTAIKVEPVTTKESETKFFESEEKKIASLNTTPISKKNLEDDDERVSPFFLRFTQESCDDDLDVVWDWDSPRSKPNRTLRKRILHSSPKIPKKQVPSEKNLPQFNSLKAQLEQLAYNLNVDSACDDSLVKSEALSKKPSDLNDIFILPKIPVKDQVTTPANNLFDDSFDEEMIKCSQKVEESFMLNKWCSSIMHNNNKETKSHLEETMKDDSFDIFLEAVDMEKLSQPSSSASPPQLKPKSSFTITSPRSISRTNSVPIEIFTKPTISTVTYSSLVSRTKSEESGRSDKIQCSPEQIEKKRQEARAKLELKKKQHEIERKRLEALERLKKNQARKLSQKR